MTGIEIVEKLSIKTYNEPLINRFKGGDVSDLTDPTNVLMLLIDFNTSMDMGGISSYVLNSSGIYAEEAVLALAKIGCIEESKQLKEIVSLGNSKELDDEIYDQMDELSCVINRDIIAEKMSKFAADHKDSLLNHLAVTTPAEQEIKNKVESMFKADAQRATEPIVKQATDALKQAMKRLGK